MTDYLLVLVFGALGAVSRYAVDGWISDLVKGQFPLGTFVINAVGSFLLGAVVEHSIRSVASPHWRVALGMGFLGAFTTFSTFAYETVHLLQDSAYLTAAINVVATVVVGLAAAALGIVTVRALG